jgi:hypothetical protein
MFGDHDDNLLLSWHEFQRLVDLKQGPPEDDHEKLKWYWKHFASYKEKGMTKEEFFAGSRLDNPDSSWEEIMGIFMQLDHNENGFLSRKEFMSISEMDGEEHDGKDEDEMNADDYWQHFSKGSHMNWIDFKRAYEHAEPGVTW